MYRDGGTWRTADLARGPADALGEHFAGSVGATSPDIEYFVQAVDASGNVGVSSNKATLFDAVASPVANLAPAPSLTQGVSATAGVPVTIGGRFSDPDGPVPATARIDLGAGAGFQPLAITAGAGGGTFTTTATYPTAGPRTVTVEVCDAALACGRATTTVGVVLRVNQAPSVSISPTASIGVTSTNIPIRITYADADGPTPRTMAIDLGTGAGFQPVSPVPSSGATRNLKYSVPGQYEVRVRVCDALGACGTATTQVLVLSGLGSAGKVVPILDCVKVSGSTMITRWGYRNTASSTVNLPIGLGNFVVPSPSNRGQPTSFPTGERHEVFTVTTTGWYVAWVLNGRLAVAIRGAVPAGVRTCS